MLSFVYKLIVSNIPNWLGAPGGAPRGTPLLAASGMAGNALKSGKGPPAPGCPGWKTSKGPKNASPAGPGGGGGRPTGSSAKNCTILGSLILGFSTFAIVFGISLAETPAFFKIALWKAVKAVCLGPLSEAALGAAGAGAGAGLGAGALGAGAAVTGACVRTVGAGLRVGWGWGTWGLCTGVCCVGWRGC